MLEVLRRSQRWIMWLVIIGVGSVFVIFVGVGSPTLSPGDEVVVAVGDRAFGPRDVDRVRRRQEEVYRRQLGDDFDSSAASDQLDMMAAGALVDRALRAGEAERLGLVVSDDELREFMRGIPWAVDENGRLQAEVIRYNAESEYGTQELFEEFLRMELLAQKFDRTVSESLEATPQQARESILYRQEEARIAYLALETSLSGDNLEIAEAEIEALLDADEARVRERYDARAAQYEKPEAVHARHILFRVDEGAPEEEVAKTRERAEQTLRRIREGADFVDTALEVSEDEGTRAQGGDLGFVPRGGQITQALEDVAFELEVREVSDLVRTSAGFHLLLVDERRAAGTVAFDDVKADLAREVLLEERAGAAAREKAEALAAAVESGSALVDAAREAGIAIERPDPVRRRPDGYVPGLGPAPDLLTSVFTLVEGASSPRIFEVRGRLVLVQLLERTTPSEAEIEAQIGAELDRLRSTQLAGLPYAWIDRRRRELIDEGQLVYDLSKLP